MIYQSKMLNQLPTSKAHPTEIVRNHLLSIANWVLFLLHSRAVSKSSVASAALAGQPGGTPGPVAGDDPRALEEPSLRGEGRAR